MKENEIKKILSLHKLWLLYATQGKRAYLGGADLRGANLSEADLSEANLRGADLREADLGEADLRGTILDGIKFTPAKEEAK